MDSAMWVSTFTGVAAWLWNENVLLMQMRSRVIDKGAYRLDKNNYALSNSTDLDGVYFPQSLGYKWPDKKICLSKLLES